ncbi:transposable element Tcb1 transposase [Trichonephila clavipes]|nr:transposable element Tcb1 transposase [Trichonephila clavipes]
MSRRKQRSALDQVTEFDRGRIVAYRDCGLSFWEIGSRVGRNQTTVMRICDRWMQEGTKDRRRRSHPHQCTTSAYNAQLKYPIYFAYSVHLLELIGNIREFIIPKRRLRILVERFRTDSSHILRRLQQSGLCARRPLLGLPLTQNHRRLHRQWCDERKMWAAEWNEAIFTDEPRI